MWNSLCLDRNLLDFTARKLRSVVMKILRFLRFDSNSSIKLYFLDIFSLNHNIYRALKSL